MSFDRLVFHESKDRNTVGKKPRSKVTYIFKASVNWLFIYSRTCISFKWNVDKFDNEICFLSNLLNTTCKHNMDFFFLYLFLTQPLLILVPTPGENLFIKSDQSLIDLHICFPIFNSWVFVVITVDLFVVIDIYSGNYHHISEEQLHKLRCSIKSTIINAQFNKSDSQLKSTVIITRFFYVCNMFNIPRSN